MSTSKIHQTEVRTSLTVVSELKNKALIANLWVILATIIISATITTLFGDEGVSEALVGFAIYFVTNSLALWAAYNKRDKLALFGYTTQVFIVCTVAMILMNEIPAHLVLAMVNFVLLHAVVVGSRTALVVTGIMVSMLLGADILGNAFAPIIAEKVTSGEVSLSLSDRTTLMNLLTTTISTGYLIVTTIKLQDQAREEALSANQMLSIAQVNLQARMEKDQLLTSLGAEVAAARSLKELNASLLKTLEVGLPNYTASLSDIEGDTDGIPIASGSSTLLLRTEPPLTFEDRNFAQNAVNLIEGALTRMMAENRARKSERLEGVGKLAASIAHDFNNLLVPIIAAVELPSNDKEIEPDVQRAAVEATIQASALVKKLLTHACSLDSMVEPLDLCDVIRSSEYLLRSFFDGDAHLTIILPDTPAPIKADTVEIEQVLLNTVLNAIEATQGTGKVELEVTIQPETVTIEIRDDGPGIPKSIQSWVLEPFHTTKTDGSGLGLTTVHRIVTDYNGTLQLRNRSQGGALIQVVLPKIDARLLRQEPTTQQHLDDVVYSILLVDDDPRVGSTIQMMLESIGHHVDYIADSRTVAQQLSNGHPYDLVITDYQMPGTTGGDIVRFLREDNDDTPVVILSGYGAALNTDDEHQPNLILSKPIRIGALNKAIRTVMSNGA